MLFTLFLLLMIYKKNMKNIRQTLKALSWHINGIRSALAILREFSRQKWLILIQILVQAINYQPTLIIGQHDACYRPIQSRTLDDYAASCWFVLSFYQLKSTPPIMVECLSMTSGLFIAQFCYTSVLFLHEKVLQLAKLNPFVQCTMKLTHDVQVMKGQAKIV